MIIEEKPTHMQSLIAFQECLSIILDKIKAYSKMYVIINHFEMLKFFLITEFFYVYLLAP